MSRFIDAADRAWDLTLTSGDMRRVKSALGLYLPDMVKDQTVLAKLTNDMELLAETLLLCTQRQRESQGVDNDAFLDALNGDTIEAATNALVLAVIDFFPPAQRRPLKAGWAATQRGMNAASDEATAKIEAIDVEAVARAAVQSAASGKLPASAELTPDR